MVQDKNDEGLHRGRGGKDGEIRENYIDICKLEGTFGHGQ